MRFFADTYGYALSGRLGTVHRGGALSSDYGFDANGNRTSHRIGPASPLRGQSWPCLGTLPAGGDTTVNGSCTYEYTRNGELIRRVAMPRELSWQLGVGSRAITHR